MRCDDEVAHIGHEQRESAEHGAHARLGEIVQQPEAGTDVEVDGRYEDPEQDPDGLDRLAGIDEIGHHRRDADDDTHQPDDPTRIDHGALGDEPCSEERGEAAADEMHRPGEDAGFARSHSEIAHQEGGSPPDETPTPKGCERAAEHDVHGRALLQQVLERCAEARCDL